MGAFDGELAALGYKSKQAASDTDPKMTTFYITWDSDSGQRAARGRHYKRKSSAIRRYWIEFKKGKFPSLWFKAKGFEKGKHLGCPHRETVLLRNHHGH
jgi:hypothetical protein